MATIFRIIILSLTVISLVACSTSPTNKALDKFDGMVDTQLKTLSPKQKLETCVKLKSNHNKYGKKIIPFIWQYIKKLESNKMTYKKLTKAWVVYTTLPDKGLLGKEYTFYRLRTLLNFRFASKLDCPWMKTKIMS